MLAGVDLDLQPHLQRWGVLGLESVDEVDAPLFQLALRLAQPRIQHTPNQVERLADRLGFDLNEVDVLRVAGSRLQVELVERGAAAESEAVGDVLDAEHLDDRPTDDEVLFDMSILPPRRMRAPCGDVVFGDHS